MSVVYVRRACGGVQKDVAALLESAGVSASGRVVLKPNLITCEASPTTTPVDIVEALAEWFMGGGCEVIVAEGSGWGDTWEAYKALGYTKLAERGVKLVDLNMDSYEVVENESAIVLKKFEFPLTLKDAYVVSVPVLKEHSITGVTLSLKNMLGVALGEKGRVARKGRFHRLGIDESIVDVNMYVKPKLAVIDGRVAGVGGELGSKPRKLGVIIASEDLVAADAYACTLLGYNPHSIRHLVLAWERGLGSVNLNEVEVVEL
ncbi:MAG: DUF362 domain-containing protein [Candidatus Freyarchaeota archaeon]|nr:DUF362 domain-containing protein [Candidatus Jordarchaeia archaeon]